MAIYLNVMNLAKDLDGCPIDNAITSLARELAKLRNSFKNNDSSNIDITLMLPSTEARPASNGMQMTSYSAQSDTLYIQAAIPEKMLHSQHANQYVSALVQDAIDNSAIFFAEKGRHFPTLQWLSALQAINHDPVAVA